jgi:DNA polymerase I
VTTDSANTVYLLDTHGLVFQMFHGMPPMNAPDGRPTNAVFGVTRAIMDLYDHGAQYLLAIFDPPGATFREAIDANYKAHRDPPPDDLRAQEPLIAQVLTAMRVPVLMLPGYEADDLIATLTSEAVARGHDVVLCTSDKDCRQLLGPKVTIRNLRKGVTLDAEGLKADWGIRPDQVVDYQTLVGDSADNVKGLPGCGPKTASKWLQEYDTLDNLKANVDKLGGPKLRESFKTAIADGSLEICRTLVRLRTDVPLPLDWDGWKRRDWDGQRLLELFQEFDFRGYANRVRRTLASSGAAKNAEALAVAGLAPAPVAEEKEIKKPRPGERGLFDALDDDNPFDSPAPAKAPKIKSDWKTTAHLVNTPELFADFLKTLQQQKRFAIDLETTSLAPIGADIVGIAFSWNAGEAYYLALRGPADSTVLKPADTLLSLKPILEDDKIAKVNQNIKYDLLVFRANGITLRGIAGDSMIAHYLLHAGERSHSLDDLTLKFFGHKKIPTVELLGKGKKQITMDAVPIDKVCEYACEDADAAWRLTEKLEAELSETPALRKLYDELEIPLIEVLAELEYNGVLLDTAMLSALNVEMGKSLDELEKQAHEEAGQLFNLASPLQLREILFDKMKLPIRKRTGTTNEPSTDQETLENLAALGHALPKILIQHRQTAKLKGTYVEALPALINPTSHRLHTSFNQTVTTTGRLSSSDPNLQNIPARTEQGQQIRKAFIAQPGWVILTADYSQIELRFLAHFSGDENLQKAFTDDRDVHTLVAAQVFNVPEAEVTKTQRGTAKTTNFGVIYGISATGLAMQLGIQRKTAAHFIDDYFAKYPKVLDYQDTLLANARRTGAVNTIRGRQRTFDPSAIRPHSRYEQRNQAEREAINMEIQGSAADLMKVAMLNVYRVLQKQKLRTKMLLSVHDELVFEVPQEELAKVQQLVCSEMTTAMTLSVPLKVDVAVGCNWLDGEEVG